MLLSFFAMFQRKLVESAFNFGLLSIMGRGVGGRVGQPSRGKGVRQPPLKCGQRQPVAALSWVLSQLVH